MKAGRNTVGTAQFSKRKGDSWAAFDNLPPECRFVLNEGLVSWSDIQLFQAVKRMRRKKRWSEDEIISWVVSSIQTADVREVNAFSIKQPGGYSPHVAADATILRYDEVSLHKRARTYR